MAPPADKSLQQDQQRPTPGTPLAVMTHRELASRLAKQPMYRGATGDSFFSVAQHCCVVAAEILHVGGPTAALYALLHHAADAVDDDASNQIKTYSVKALHAGLQLPWPMLVDEIALHQLVHLRAELSERRQFAIGPQARIDALLNAGVKPLPASIRALNWDRAADRFLSDLQAYTQRARTQ